MLTIAVTGGIGAGKSAVSRYLAALGAVIADSDHLARVVVAPGSPGLERVIEAFGPGVRAADGSLDRAALAAIVFADPAQRRRLEAITHPLIRAAVAQIAAGVSEDSVLVNDIPLLVSLSQVAEYHLVIGVGVDDDIRLQRLIARGHTEADARARMAAQISDDRRRPLADAWLDNSGDHDALDAVVQELWERRIEPMRAALAAGRPAPIRPGPVGLDAGAVDRWTARVAAATGAEIALADTGAGLTGRVVTGRAWAQVRGPLAAVGLLPADPETAPGATSVVTAGIDPCVPLRVEVEVSVR